MVIYSRTLLRFVENDPSNAVTARDATARIVMSKSKTAVTTAAGVGAVVPLQ